MIGSRHRGSAQPCVTPLEQGRARASNGKDLGVSAQPTQGVGGSCLHIGACLTRLPKSQICLGWAGIAEEGAKRRRALVGGEAHRQICRRSGCGPVSAIGVNERCDSADPESQPLGQLKVVRRERIKCAEGTQRHVCLPGHQPP